MLLNFNMRMEMDKSNLAGLVATKYDSDEGFFDIAEHLFNLICAYYACFAQS